jgi:tetratricopeptide (TPR) repeat protein
MRPQQPAGSSTPNVSRTMTPHMPITPTKRPAPPSLPQDLEPPTQPRTQLGGYPAGAMRPPAPEPIDPPTVRRASTGDIQLVLPNATDEERRALAEPCDLASDERLRLLAMARLVNGHDPWALLGVPAGADAKVLKRAYFKLSKEVHPDRFYGKQLGSFADRLSVVFEAIARAYARLTSSDKDRRSGGYQQVAEQPQTPAEYASELFERACGLEVGGDALGAMKLFAAAVRIDPQVRYLRRAATCALAAEQPKTALEYAKKAQNQAPSDPSAARLLASAFKATGRLADAEEVLVMAMALKSENDVLGAELRNDLAEVRRLMTASSG